MASEKIPRVEKAATARLTCLYSTTAKSAAIAISIPAVNCIIAATEALKHQYSSETIPAANKLPSPLQQRPV